MRTLQEKYNGIQEGKFSKEHFLAEARMQQPQLITRFNGYDDAVQILKNKGMIQEIASFAERFKEYSNDALTDMVINLSRYQGNEKEIEEVKAELERRKQAIKEASYKTSSNSKEAQHLKKGDIITSGDEVVSVSAGAKTPAGKVEVTLKTKSGSTKTSTWGKTTKVGVKPKETVNEISNILRGFLKGVRSAVEHEGTEEQVNRYVSSVESNMRKPNGHEKYMGWEESDYITDFNRTLTEAKQTKLTKKSLTDYRYKPTNDMDKYPYEQILRGIRVELEVLGVHGTPTAEEYSKALAKVSKNLAKDSIFYTNQVAGVNPKVDLHDKMVPVTAKNTVDTFNGMKKAALKEGFKNLIKKVLTEDSETSSRAIQHGQPSEEEYEFYSDPENYKDAEEEFELQGEEDLDESATGEIYQIAQEYDRFEDFVQAVEQEFGPVEDIAELEYIFNSTRKEDDIQYDDENFSDPMIDGEDDLYETRKAKSLSQLLK